MSDLIYSTESLDVRKYAGSYEVEDLDDGSLIDMSPSVALDVAKAILKAEGNSPEGAVLASEVSFNEGLFRLAAAHGKEVLFRYAKGKDGKVIEQRVLKPEGIKKVGDHLTFIGYDPDRDGPRAYRLDRVKGEVTVR